MGLSQQHASVSKQIKQMFPQYRLKHEHHLGQRLFLDIFMSDISIGVEINGQQHYEYIPFFHGTEIKFEEYKMLDRKKMKLCQEQGIGLYIVKYDQKFDINDFMDFVIKHLRSQVRNGDND